MKKRLICLSAAAMLFFQSGTAAAIALIDGNSIVEAQAYGQKNADISFADFLRPWSATALKKNGPQETAYLYTPYLAIASDARTRSLAGKKTGLTDCENALADYNGTMSLSLVLYGAPDSLFKNKPKINAYAGKQVIKPYRIVWPEGRMTQVEFEGKRYAAANCYVYFSDNELRGIERIVLRVNTADGIEHQFCFDLTKLK